MNAIAEVACSGASRNDRRADVERARDVGGRSARRPPGCRVAPFEDRRRLERRPGEQHRERHDRRRARRRRRRGAARSGADSRRRDRRRARRAARPSIPSPSICSDDVRRARATPARPTARTARSSTRFCRQVEETVTSTPNASSRRPATFSGARGRRRRRRCRRRCPAGTTRGPPRAVTPGPRRQRAAPRARAGMPGDRPSAARSADGRGSVAVTRPSSPTPPPLSRVTSHSVGVWRTTARVGAGSHADRRRAPFRRPPART